MVENQSGPFHVSKSKIRTRPCDFRVSTDDFIIADFVRKKQNFKLARISFDGFGCCNCGGVRLMDAADARPLLAMVEGSQDSQEELGAIMTRYCTQTKDVLWAGPNREHK